MSRLETVVVVLLYVIGCGAFGVFMAAVGLGLGKLHEAFEGLRGNRKGDLQTLLLREASERRAAKGQR